MLRSRRILLAAALGLAATAAPASAELGVMTVHYYDVVIEGEASYAMHAESPPTELGISTIDHAADFSWQTDMSSMAFYDGRATGAAGKVTSLYVTKANRRVHLANKVPDTSECSGTAANADPSHGIIRMMGAAPGGGSRLGIEVLANVEFGLPNCTGTNTPGRILLHKRPNATTHPFETWFDLPPDAIGQGKIIQLVDRKVTGNTECPNGEGSLHNRTCSLTWNAKVTFTKTRTDILPIGKDPLEPAPAPAPAPAPKPAPVPAPPAPLPPADLPTTIDEDLLVPLVKQAAVTPAAATVPVTCPSGCIGAAVATPLAKGARAAAKPRPLARTTFSAAPGRKAVVKLRFDARARRAVRRAGGVNVTITARPRGGGVPVRKTVTLRLKRR